MTADVQTNKEPECCYYCEDPLEQDGTVDWCWIKKGPDGCGIPSLKVHDSCAAPLIETAKKIRLLTEETAKRIQAGEDPPVIDPVPGVVAKLCEAGMDDMDLDDMVKEAAAAIATDINNKGMEDQARYLMSNGYDPLTLLET